MNIETYYCEKHKALSSAYGPDRNCTWAAWLGPMRVDPCDIVPVRIRGRRLKKVRV